MIKEYGDLAPGEMAVRSTIATGGPNGKYRLVHSTAGYECAGSCARSTAEKWGVLTGHAGCPRGQWFKTLAEAEVLFAERTGTERTTS